MLRHIQGIFLPRTPGTPGGTGEGSAKHHQEDRHSNSSDAGDLDTIDNSINSDSHNTHLKAKDLHTNSVKTLDPKVEIRQEHSANSVGRHSVTLGWKTEFDNVVNVQVRTGSPSISWLNIHLNRG